MCSKIHRYDVEINIIIKVSSAHCTTTITAKRLIGFPGNKQMVHTTYTWIIAKRKQEITLGYNGGIHDVDM